MKNPSFAAKPNALPAPFAVGGRRIPLLWIALAINAVVLMPVLWSGFYMDDSLNAATRGGTILEGVGIWTYTFRFFKAWLQIQGRLSPFLHIGYPMLYFITNPILYKALIFILTLAGTAGFYQFVRRMAGSESVAFLSSVTLPVCIQFRCSADPILAFSALYPILSVLLFWSLVVFCRFLEDGKRPWLAPVLFSVAALIYETLYPLVLAFLAISFAYRKAWRPAIRAITPLLLIVVSLVLLNVYFRSQATGLRPGGAYVPNLHVVPVLKSYLVQLGGVIPFVYSLTDPHSIFAGTPFTGVPNFLLLLSLAAFFGAGIGMGWLRQGNAGTVVVEKSGAKVLAVVAAMLLLLPSMPISLSPKYQAMKFGDAYLQVLLSCFGLALLLGLVLERVSRTWRGRTWRMAVVTTLAIGCALQWSNNSRVVARLNSYYLEPRQIAEHGVQRAFATTLGSGSVILTEGSYVWTTAQFFTQWAGTAQSLEIVSQEGNFIGGFRKVGALCTPQDAFVTCTFPPQAKAFFFRVQSFAPGQGTASLSRLRWARVAGARIVGLSAEEAFVYFEPGPTLRTLQPAVHARDTEGNGVSDFWVRASDLQVVGGAPGWQCLRLRHQGFDPTSLDALWSLPHTVDLPPMASPRRIVSSNRKFALESGAPIHLAYGKMNLEDWGPGVVIGEMKWPPPVSVEVVVRPAAEQRTNATILSNHGAAYTGITIEQIGVTTNLYAVGVGSGASYVRVGSLQLAPQRRAYIAFQIGDEEARLYLNGNLVSSRPVKPALATRGIPLRVGNWMLLDRPFRGDIEEVAIGPGLRTAAQIKAQAAKLGL